MDTTIKLRNFRKVIEAQSSRPTRRCGIRTRVRAPTGRETLK